MQHQDACQAKVMPLKERIKIWDERAARPGDLKVMSAQLEHLEYDSISAQYQKAVYAFIDAGKYLKEKSVLELGCGHGRFTLAFTIVANSVACIDGSTVMIELCRAKTREHKTTFFQMAVSDFRPQHRYDVAVCSQILAHLVTPEEFTATAAMLDSWCDDIFLFEHTGGRLRVSDLTVVRSEEELLRSFSHHTLSKKQTYWLVDDELSFLHLVPLLGKCGHSLDGADPHRCKGCAAAYMADWRRRNPERNRSLARQHSQLYRDNRSYRERLKAKLASSQNPSVPRHGNEGELT